MNRQATKNAGRSSYIFHAPPIGRIRYFQINTIAPPETIPASAPKRFVLLQNKEQSMTGPNEAPKPAQAKDTIPNLSLIHI